MRSPFAGALAVCALPLATQTTFAAQLSPMERLARDLGTPKMGYTVRNDAHTHSMFEWVPAGETVKNWTKLFTVVATRVDADRTQSETRATILRERGLLKRDHANVSVYDVRNQAPPVAYFKYTIRGEINVGVIFSPLPGFVTIQQVAAHRAGVITAQDIRRMKALVGYPG
jgi:hypothetical protein